MDRGAWQATVHGAQTWETSFQTLCQEDPLEKGMATHSSIFSWRIPWTEEPGGLQSMGLQRVSNLYTEYILQNAGLEEAQAGIKIAGRNIRNLRYADDTTLMEESEEELKSLLMKVTVESEKVGLKLNIQKTKIMASGPITSWEIDGETVETVSDFILGVSKMTADGDCSHEIKRHLLLGWK